MTAFFFPCLALSARKIFLRTIALFIRWNFLPFTLRRCDILFPNTLSYVNLLKQVFPSQMTEKKRIVFVYQKNICDLTVGFVFTYYLSCFLFSEKNSGKFDSSRKNWKIFVFVFLLLFIKKMEFIFRFRPESTKYDLCCLQFTQRHTLTFETHAH